MSANQNSTQDIEAAREVFAAINRGEISAVLKLLDPEIKRIEFEGSPSAVCLHGHADVEKHFSQARSSWSEGTCEPEQFLVADDKIVALVHVRVKLKNKLEWIDGHLGEVFTFRNGKIIEMRAFLEKENALAWAGVKE